MSERSTSELRPARCERGNPLPPHGLLFPISRQDSTYHGLCYTSHGALAGTRNSSQGPPFWMSTELLGAVVSSTSGKGIRSWCDGSSDISFMGWTHWAISRSSQCSKTGVIKAVECAILSGMVHIEEPLLLIGKSCPCGGSGFPLSLSEWYSTICLTPYNRK